jgi:hypothetical protein
MENDPGYSKIGVDPTQFDNGQLKFKDFFSIPPMIFTKYFHEVPFIDRYPNGKAFLIASGPSFAKVDYNLLRQPGILTMGINNSVKTFRPNLWTCVDDPASFLQSCWMDPRIEKIVPISHINKTLTDSTTQELKSINMKVGDCPNVFYYRRNEVVNTKQYLFEDTINWGNHSEVGGGRSVFMAATRLMYLLGIRKLFLLGVDFKMDNGYYYHFPQERSRGSINGNNHTYSSMMKWFGEMREMFEEVGFSVYNCNPDSALKVFPFKSVDEALSIALEGFPQTDIEKTEGMYTRKVDEEKKQRQKDAAIKAAKYTEQDRTNVQVELNEKKKLLSKAKEETKREMLVIIKSLSPKDITALEKTTTKKEEVLKDLSEKVNDPQFANVINAKIKEVEVRKSMRDCEIKKNEIHGIIK